MTKKKKIIVLSVMIGLLVLTGYINVALNNSLSSTTKSTTTQTSTSSQSFYTTYKTERESTRQQELQFYEAIIASSTSSEEAKDEAEQNKLALINQMEKELVVEGIIEVFVPYLMSTIINEGIGETVDIQDMDLIWKCGILKSEKLVK